MWCVVCCTGSPRRDWRQSARYSTGGPRHICLACRTDSPCCVCVTYRACGLNHVCVTCRAGSLHHICVTCRTGGPLETLCDVPHWQSPSSSSKAVCACAMRAIPLIFSRCRTFCGDRRWVVPSCVSVELALV